MVFMIQLLVGHRLRVRIKFLIVNAVMVFFWVTWLLKFWSEGKEKCDFDIILPLYRILLLLRNYISL